MLFGVRKCSQEKHGHFHAAREVQAEHRMFHPTFTSPSRLSTHTPYHPLRSVRAKHEGSHVQASDGRSRSGGGMAWRRSPDFHPSVHIPTLRCKIGPPFSEFTTCTSSIPQELQAIIPTLAVPVQPVLLEEKREYAMFVDFLKTYHWVLPIHYYTDQDHLLAALKEAVIEPAEQKAQELEKR
jgi:hypothetical protein